jgi:hypothetical protein
VLRFFGKTVLQWDGGDRGGDRRAEVRDRKPETGELRAES